jgi:hypothetical protein
MDKDTTISCLSSPDLFTLGLFIYNGPDDVANNKEEMTAIHHHSHYKPAKKCVLARFIADHSDWGKHPWTNMQEFHKAVCMSCWLRFEQSLTHKFQPVQLIKQGKRMIVQDLEYRLIDIDGMISQPLGLVF